MTARAGAYEDVTTAGPRRPAGEGEPEPHDERDERALGDREERVDRGGEPVARATTASRGLPDGRAPLATAFTGS